MRVASGDSWAIELSQHLTERWPSIAVNSIKSLATYIASKEEWRNHSPILAAIIFACWSEECCWIEGLNTTCTANSKNNDNSKLAEMQKLVVTIDTSKCIPTDEYYRAYYLRLFWESAGFPDSVRPTENTINAIQAYELAQ